MLKLSGSDRNQLRNAITKAFASRKKIQIFADSLDVDLNEIASESDTTDAAFDLVDWARRENKLVELIVSLYQQKSNNPDVRQFYQRVQDLLQEHLVLNGEGITEVISRPFDWQGPTTDTELEAFFPARALSFETDVGQLKRGLQCADSICKVVFTDSDRTGTGVLVAADLILTNYHVLTEETVDSKRLNHLARSLCFEFGYVSEERETPVRPEVYAVAVEKPVVAFSPISSLDYVLLRAEAAIAEANHIKPLVYVSTATLPEPKKGLYVLQHPEGELMQVSLSDSGVVGFALERDRIWYVNRTKKGSSGSPCFNERWQLIALHHLSMSRGFGSIREGILFQSIYQEIAPFLQ
ncbi:MAG: trypsin-like peptidase domain-containing protein [Cyanophyceae cyanobacterium]